VNRASRAIRKIVARGRMAAAVTLEKSGAVTAGRGGRAAHRSASRKTAWVLRPAAAVAGGSDGVFRKVLS